MRTLTLVQTTVFATLVLGVATAATLRLTSFSLPADAAWSDGRAAKAFESHYDREFPARSLGVSVWAAIDYVLFNEGRPGIVVGQNGWLYSDEEFKTYLEADAAVRTHLALLPWVRDELARQGSQLVVALVPSKARIYPEHVGTRRPAALHETLYAQAHRTLVEAGIPAPDLALALTQCKRNGPTFLRTDTHWTPAGAQCAAQAVVAHAPRDRLRRPPGAYVTRIQGREFYRGDLFKFLPLEPYFSELLPEPEEIEIRRTELAGGGLGLLDDTAAPEVVLIGTSYSADERWNLTGALQESLQADVVNYAVRGQGPFVPMLDYLMKSRDLPTAPRVVIWEIPERYLPIAQDLRVTRDDANCVVPVNARSTL